MGPREIIDLLFAQPLFMVMMGVRTCKVFTVGAEIRNPNNNIIYLAFASATSFHSRLRRTVDMAQGTNIF